MIVKNETTLNKDDCYDMMLQSTKKEYIQKSYLIIFMFIAGLVIMIVGLTMAQDASNNKLLFTITGAIFLALGLVYLGVTLFNIHRIPKLIRTKNRDLCEYGISYNFQFKEESVELSCKTLDKTSKQKISYNNLKKTYEYEDLFVMIFSDGTYLYVKKDGFEEPKSMDIFRKNITKIAGNDKKKRKLILKNKKYYTK